MSDAEHRITVVLVCGALLAGCSSDDTFGDDAAPLFPTENLPTTVTSVPTTSSVALPGSDELSVPDEPTAPPTSAVPDEPTVPPTTAVPDEPTVPASTVVADEPTVPPTTAVADEPGIPTTSTTVAGEPRIPPTTTRTILQVPIDWNQACREQYEEPNAYARADEDVYTAWRCYVSLKRIERELGGINVERYCETRGMSVVLLPEMGRDSWRCERR